MHLSGKGSRPPYLAEPTDSLRRRRSMQNHSRRTAVFGAALVVIAGACSPAASTAPSTGAATTGPAASTAASTAASQAPAASAAAELNLPAVPTGYTELDKALGSDKPYNGLKVSIQTQWTGGEADGFAAAIKDFQAATGIAVQV